MEQRGAGTRSALKVERKVPLMAARTAEPTAKRMVGSSDKHLGNCSVERLDALMVTLKAVRKVEKKADHLAGHLADLLVAL